MKHNIQRRRRVPRNDAPFRDAPHEAADFVDDLDLPDGAAMAMMGELTGMDPVDVLLGREAQRERPKPQAPHGGTLKASSKTKRRALHRKRTKQRRKRLTVLAKALGWTPGDRMALKLDRGVWWIVGCAEGPKHIPQTTDRMTADQALGLAERFGQALTAADPTAKIPPCQGS